MAWGSQHSWTLDQLSSCLSCVPILVFVNDHPVNSITLSAQFSCLPLLLPEVVSSRIVVERVLAFVMWPYHFKFLFLMVSYEVFQWLKLLVWFQIHIHSYVTNSSYVTPLTPSKMVVFNIRNLKANIPDENYYL